MGRRLPAVAGDQVGVVPHRRRPVVHEVLVDRICIDQRLAAVVLKKSLAERMDELLRLEAWLECLELLCLRIAPCREVGIHPLDEGRELRMAIDAGLDGRLVDGQVQVALPVGLEQRTAQLRANVPVGLQRVHVGHWNPALQMPFDVLPVFR